MAFYYVIVIFKKSRQYITHSKVSTSDNDNTEDSQHLQPQLQLSTLSSALYSILYPILMYTGATRLINGNFYMIDTKTTYFLEMFA